jgi:hypothetical protein
VEVNADLRLFREDGMVDPERGVRFAQAFAAWELGRRFAVSEALIREGIELASD